MRLNFLNLIMLSLFISIFILIFLAIYSRNKKTYAYFLNYYIGFFIAIRLVISIPISLPTTINNYEVINNVSTDQITENAIDGEIKDVIEVVEKGEKTENKRILIPVNILDWFVKIWLVGFIFSLMIRFWTYIKFYCYIRKRGIDVEQSIYLQFTDIKTSMNCLTDVRLVKIKNISSPFVIGVLSKMVVIPDIDYAGQELELEYIFKHELTHIKRYDNIYKLLLVVSQCIHWFNPVIYLYFRIVERDLEYLCDRQVVQNMGKEYRKQYCNSILRMMENEQINKYKKLRVKCLSDFGQDKKTLKERMRNILDSNNVKVKKSTIIFFAFSILLISSLVVFYKDDNSFLHNILPISADNSTTQIQDYGVFENFNGYSNLDIFPETITENMDVTKYTYKYRDEFLDPSAQIYLESRFDNDGYEKEIERLAAIYEEYKGTVQNIVYDTEMFQYPAYVTINGNNHCYEYALLLEDNRIAYIFLQFVEKNSVEIPLEYLPTDYEETKENGSSIYVFYREDGTGYCTY